jgi:hypothetical protein
MNLPWHLAVGPLDSAPSSRTPSHVRGENTASTSSAGTFTLRPAPRRGPYLCGEREPALAATFAPSRLPSSTLSGGASCELIAGRGDHTAMSSSSAPPPPCQPAWPGIRRLPLVNSILHPTTAAVHLVVDRQSLVRVMPTGVDRDCAGALPHLLSAPCTIDTISSTACDGSSSAPEGSHLHSGDLPAHEQPETPKHRRSA